MSLVSDELDSRHNLNEDKVKLRNLIRLCMNDDYLKHHKQINKATFKSKAKPEGSMADIMKEFEVADQTGLAFRRSALTALNQDQILFQRLEMNHYIEDVRKAANKEIYDFFEQIDPDTAPKNLKLLYFYFVGSRNLQREMVAECISDYKEAQMKPVRNELRQSIAGKTRNPKRKNRD